MKNRISEFVDKVKKVGRAVVLGTVLYATNFASGDVEQGKMYIKSELPRKTLVSGSERVYNMNVIADNSGIPYGISTTKWKVINTMDYVQNLTSQRPGEHPTSTNPNDFWYNIALKSPESMYNTIDPDGNDTEFWPNARGPPASLGDSASGRGELQNVFFKTKSGIDVGGDTLENRFRVSFVDITDININHYKLSNDNLTIETDRYTILNSLSPFDRVGNPDDINDNRPDLPDGDVDNHDYEVFKSCISGPSVPHNGSSDCLAMDIDADGDVDQRDFGKFQRCLSGDDVPANPECAGVGTGVPASSSATYNQSLSQSYDFTAPEKQSWEEGGREEKSIGFKLTDILMDFGEVFYNQERQKR